MRFQKTLAFGFRQIKNKAAPFLFQSQASRCFSSQLQSEQQRWSSFGIAFDIDGVILRGQDPIGGSPQALRRLYGDSGNLNVPFLFLTNGGGVLESKRANQLSELLGVKILPSQDQLIVATGKGEPDAVMFEYGFKNVVSLDDYASLFENIDPLAQYKKWPTKRSLPMSAVPRYDIFSERVQAVCVVSDPVDWGRDIQVLCDILRCGGLPGQENGHQRQPRLYFASDDLEYQAAFLSRRLGMGAFRIALENVFNRRRRRRKVVGTELRPEEDWSLEEEDGRLESGASFCFWWAGLGGGQGIHHNALEYVSYGKPYPFVFKHAEAMLRQLQPSYQCVNFKESEDSGLQSFKTIYMIGDNPSVDVKGARQNPRHLKQNAVGSTTKGPIIPMKWSDDS
ncbi:unnamed protein product [Dovyalis caffra]|uniref:Uncharacterized protein n=1 Tax=Dovyalis caffra TaxID=77055 RepID=A0AAV1QY61_9ROSI|nr:unnamed protein product [Dovyalis caffra]